MRNVESINFYGTPNPRGRYAHVTNSPVLPQTPSVSLLSSITG